MVAGEHPFPAPAEAGAVPALAVVAGLAESAAVEIPGSAGAAQGELMLLALGGHRGISGVFLKRPQALLRVGQPSHAVTDEALL